VKLIRIRPEQRGAIARAILDDEAGGNGEHLFDGERVIFYCPMQGAEPKDLRPRVPVRELLPAGLRVPTFADYLASTQAGCDAAALGVEERRALLAEYEAYALSWLGERLPESVVAEGP
jgi:hypothetical protein